MEASFNWEVSRLFCSQRSLTNEQVAFSRKGFNYVGPIQKNKVREFYKSLSVIVIPASGGALVTTGKVYEVAAQPHPIVCIQTKMAERERH